MRNFRRHAVILLLSICLAAAAGALGMMAWRYARREALYREQETAKLLRDQVRIIAGECRRVLSGERQELVRQLRDAPRGDIDELPRRSPLLRVIFVTDGMGNPLHPAPDDPFWERFYGLFLDADSGRDDGIAKVDATPDAAGETSLPVAGPADDKASRSTPFSREVRNAVSGWIPWFAENRFSPLLWVRDNEEENLIVGGEIETVALLARLVPLLPQQAPAYARFDLADAHGRILCSIGGNTGSGDAPADWAEPDASEEIAPLMLPNFRVRGYLNPAYRGGAGRLMLTHLLQIASLLAVLLAGGLLLLWQVRREMVMAGKKTSFVANVSHELKTPLTSIRMYAEMLGGPAGEDREKRSKYVGVILAEGERLSRLIANVLDFSRMEEGKKRYRPETFPLQEVLHEVAETWRPALSEKDIELRIEAPTQPISATVDRDALVQVLQNLLGNAGNYAAAGGEVILAASTGPAGDIVLRVLDRGPGVPPGMREKIFRKFQRGDDRLTAETTGAGLGLAIARGLLRDQGGDLTCHSRPGGGAEFRIMLPPAGL